MKLSLHLIAVGLLLVGCGKARGAPSQRSLASEQVVPVAHDAQRATAPLAQNPRDINALFQNEAEHRPSTSLPADAVMAAFRQAGIELTEERQHLARPYGARYCRGALASEDVALSVCEYVDAEAASAGAAVSRRIPLKDREITLNRSTSLTVRLINKTPASQAASQRLFQVFAAL